MRALLALCFTSSRQIIIIEWLPALGAGSRHTLRSRDKASIESSGGMQMSAVVRIVAPLAIVALMVSVVRAQDEKPTGYVGIKVNTQDSKVTINEVVDKGPAEKAGLKVGDVILKINGMEFSNEVASKFIRNGKPGDKVTFTIQREGKEQEVKVTLAEPPKMDG